MRAFNNWLDSIPVSRPTGWRWRKLGWVETVNIAGRPYITDETIARFHTRAAAGEFAAVPNCVKKNCVKARNRR